METAAALAVIHFNNGSGVDRDGVLTWRVPSPIAAERRPHASPEEQQEGDRKREKDPEQKTEKEESQRLGGPAERRERCNLCCWWLSFRYSASTCRSVELL